MINIPNEIVNADIYTRLSYKMHNEFNDLTMEERDKLEDMIIEDTAIYVHRADDELLLQMASDRGLLL